MHCFLLFSLDVSAMMYAFNAKNKLLSVLRDILCLAESFFNQWEEEVILIVSKYPYQTQIIVLI